MHLATRRRIVTFALAAALFAALPQTAGAVTPNRQRALEGSSYLVSQQRASGAICAFSCIGSTADAVLALVATRTAPRVVGGAVAYLRRQVERGNVAGLGLQAKVAMAAVAGRANPRSFGGVDLVAEMRSTRGVDGHYGDAAVFDQALVMLALRGAGAAPPGDAMSWLVAAQCADGGWQYDLPASPADDEHCLDATAPDPGDSFTSDSNTTSLAVQVLRAGGAADDGLAFLDTLREDSAGWGYSQCCTATDSNSTAMVIQAYVASGVLLPPGGFAALRQLQLRCGAWPYQAGGPDDVGATIGAILGILRRPLPVEPRTVASRVPDPRACA